MTLTMPKAETAIMEKRAEIVRGLEAIVAPGNVLADERQMRPYECDAVTMYRQLPLRRRAAGDGRRGVEDHGAGSGAQRQGRAARRRHLAVGRLAAARGWHPARAGQVQQDPRDRLREPLRRGAARRRQSRHHQGRRGRGLLLRAGPLLADRLLDRRQRGGELRRHPLLEVRFDDEQHPRARGGADGRRGAAPRRQAPRQRALRPDRACSPAPKACSASSPRSPCAS